METIVLGGGCFWCLEAIYEKIPGVLSVESGYAGGEDPDPSYEEVCRGSTGHAEVVAIQYDPDEVSLEEILTVFWKAHNPTTLNRQGADVGTQYRSIILYRDDKQKQSALESKSAAQSGFSDPIVTEVTALEKFYPGENYHQGYFQNHPSAPYCAFVIQPKLAKLGLE